MWEILDFRKIYCLKDHIYNALFLKKIWMNKMMWIRVFIFAVTVLVAGCSGGSDKGSGPDQTETIKVGLLTELADLWDQFGLPWELAARLAIEEINAGGGVLGRPLELVSLHSAPDQAAIAVNAKSMLEQGVVAVVGPAFSENFLLVATEIALPAGMLMVSPSVTAPEVSGLDAGGLVYRTTTSDALQGAVSARYAVQTLGVSTAAVLYLDNAYGQGLAASFEAEFVALGGRVVEREPFPNLDADAIQGYDYREHVEQLVVARPDLLFLVTRETANDKISIALQSVLDESYRPQLITSANRSDAWLVNAAPDVVEGMRGIVASPDLDTPGYAAFTAGLQARYQIDPVVFSDGVYDAIYLIALAIERAGSATPRAAADNIRAVSAGGTVVGPGEFSRGRELLAGDGGVDYEGASGSLTFDTNGDITSGTFLIWEIRGAEFFDLETVKFP
jgi:branched-chain amino acid transport system substrate-binding protein